MDTGGGNGLFSDLVNPMENGAFMSNRRLSKPEYLLELEKLLNIDAFLRQVSHIVPNFSMSSAISESLPISSSITKQQAKAAKNRLYDFNRIKKNKKWLRNLLTEKSDTDSSDNEAIIGQEIDLNHTPEFIKEMKKLHDLQIKAKASMQNGMTAEKFQSLASPFLDHGLPNPVPTSLTQSINSSPVKTRKPSKSFSKSGKNRQNESSFSPAVSISGTNPSTSPVILPLSEVSQSPSLTSVSSTQNATNIDSLVTESFLRDSKRLKLDSTILDEIPYDATLPDEILQSESSAIDSEPAPSYTPSMSDDINFGSHLPDDIYDTEGSCASLQSQPAKSLSGPATLTRLKCLTAPTTPAGSPPSTPSSLVINPPTKTPKRGSKKLLEASQEKVMAIKRKKIWISIARKEISRAHKQRLNTHKEMSAARKKIANWCEKELRKGDHLLKSQSNEQASGSEKSPIKGSNKVNKAVIRKRLVTKRVRRKHCTSL